MKAGSESPDHAPTPKDMARDLWWDYHWAMDDESVVIAGRIGPVAQSAIRRAQAAEAEAARFREAVLPFVEIAGAYAAAFADEADDYTFQVGHAVLRVGECRRLLAASNRGGA